MKVNCITKMYINSLANVKQIFLCPTLLTNKNATKTSQKTYKLKSDISEFICDRPGLNK